MTQPQKLGLVALFVVGNLLVWGRALRPAQEPSAPQVADVPAEAAAAVPSGVAARRDLEHHPGGSDVREAQRQHVSTLVWGRDPFSRGSSSGHLNGLLLSGILWDAQAPMAIINGSMVRVGDEVEGYEITAITQEQVSVSDGTQTFHVEIAP
jgi:hypothetical protein